MSKTQEPNPQTVLDCLRTIIRCELTAAVVAALDIHIEAENLTEAGQGGTTFRIEKSAGLLDRADLAMTTLIREMSKGG